MANARNDDQFGPGNAFRSVLAGGYRDDRIGAAVKDQSRARSCLNIALRGGATISAADWRASPAGS